MAWNIAAFAVAAAVLIAAGAFAAGIVRICRSLGRWDRLATELERKVESAMDEYVRFAREGRETAQMCRNTFGGFARLAEGARAVGDAAESAAEAAAHVASFWRDVATCGSAAEQEDDPGASSYWSAIVRTLADNLRRSFYGNDSEPYVNRRPGPGAEDQTGE